MAFLLSSCGGLGGEPAIVSTVPPLPTGIPERGYPAAPPDLARGAAIFAAHCTECHGVGGAGDGTRVQSGQIQNVPNFLDPTVPGPQRVSDWYATITNGRIENLMPPWRNALSEQERWDVAYYTYTMHATAEQLARGAEIYAESCVGCHGESGRGDGPDAASLSGSVGDHSNQEDMAALSDDHIFASISEGVGDPNDGMPGFADELSEADRRAVGAYVRTLAVINEPTPETSAQTTAQAVVPTTVPADADATAAPTAVSAVATTTPPAPAATEEPAAGPTLTVSGTVSNGSAGAAAGVTEGLEISLFIFPQDADPIELTQVSGGDGTYTFADVPLIEDAAYAVTATYLDRLFLSDIVSGADLSADPTLDVTVYELTEDPAVLTISLIETQINVTDSGLEVAQFIEVTNDSDRTFTTSQRTPDGRPISLTIPLPPGAVVPGFNAPGRYAYLPDTFTVLDTQPVYPGVIHQLQLVYLIPYEGSAILEQELNYAFDGLDQLLVRPAGVEVTAEGLAPMGTTSVGGRDFISYSGTFTRPAGSVLRVELAGSGAGSPSSFGTSSSVVSSDLAPLLLVAGGLLIGIFVGLFIWSRRPAAKPPAPTETADALARQIADLDAAHTAGEIPDDTWQKQRAALKERLTRLLMGGGGL